MKKNVNSSMLLTVKGAAPLQPPVLGVRLPRKDDQLSLEKNPKSFLALVARKESSEVATCSLKTQKANARAS